MTPTPTPVLADRRGATRHREEPCPDRCTIDGRRVELTWSTTTLGGGS